MYLLPDFNAKLLPRLLRLKPGTRIVSHDGGIGDWPPDERLEMRAPEKTVGIGGASRGEGWIGAPRPPRGWADGPRQPCGPPRVNNPPEIPVLHDHAAAPERGPAAFPRLP